MVVFIRFASPPTLLLGVTLRLEHPRDGSPFIYGGFLPWHSSFLLSLFLGEPLSRQPSLTGPPP